MATTYTKFNPNRRVAPEGSCDRSILSGLVERVRYSGNPVHKKNPGDFGLTPPSGHRRKKSLCDDTGIFSKSEALGHLKEGLRRGIVCERWERGWPKRVWSVMDDGKTVLEAIRDGEGSYHGYPLPDEDPIAHDVLERWG